MVHGPLVHRAPHGMSVRGEQCIENAVESSLGNVVDVANLNGRIVFSGSRIWLPKDVAESSDRELIAKSSGTLQYRAAVLLSRNCKLQYHVTGVSVIEPLRNQALGGQVDQFNRSRSGDERHKQWLNPTVNVLKYLKLAGQTDIEDWMKRLDRLTNEQLLKVTHDADDKLTEVGDGLKGVKSEVRVVGEKVKVVDDKLQGIIDDVKEVKAMAMEARLFQKTADVIDEEKLRWQSPPDPPTNHNLVWDYHHKGSGEWFFQGLCPSRNGWQLLGHVTQ
ncbi:hypothetical protein EDB83DRAFT_2323419 [Lactarius deliciosus]|nr:hypothetical protein EDB83DRAFT_2323419 [Lactarius deliciosus]